MIGSSSAVGTAVMKSCNKVNCDPSICLNSGAVEAYEMNDFKSVLEIPPMGLISAELQSYLVRYPRKLIH